MEWTENNYPIEMNELEPRVRNKAIEIANKLKNERSVRELSVVDEAIRLAQEWFINEEG